MLFSIAAATFYNNSVAVSLHPIAIHHFLTFVLLGYGFCNEREMLSCGFDLCFCHD